MTQERAPSRHAFGRSVPAVAENVGTLRQAVVQVARSAGADDTLATNIALAVGEACANVVVHAYPPGDVGSLIVEAEVEGDTLAVRVSDQGRGMTPRPDSPGLGLGLPLIASLTDHLGVADGPDGIGTEVTLAFKLKRARSGR